MKYIPAEKLITEIKGIITAVQTKNHPDVLGTMEQCIAAAEIEALNLVLDAIKELQQEQPGLPGIEEPGIPGKDYIPVDWVDACEMYGKWKIVKQEQPEVDVKKELHAYICSDEYMNTREDGSLLIARHFYELGLNARKEK